jgi:hypothetical protein
MTRIKRVGLSFACALASDLLFSSGLMVLGGNVGSGANGGIGVVASVWIIFCSTGFLVIPGWLLSLPLVLVFDRAEGWRFWVLGIYGTLLGPAILAALILAQHGSVANEDFALYFGFAFVVAFLSTAIYLSVLKHYSRDSIEQAPS